MISQLSSSSDTSCGVVKFPTHISVLTWQIPNILHSVDFVFLDTNLEKENTETT